MATLYAYRYLFLMLVICVSNIDMKLFKSYTKNREKYYYNPVSTSGSLSDIGGKGELYYGHDHFDTLDSIYSGVADADVNTENSVHSDGINSVLYGQASAGASVGNGGVQADAAAAGSISKHSLGDVDIHVGQGNAYAGASVGVTGAYVGVGAELNVVSVEHENVQCRVGLDASTGAGVSATDVYVAVGGLGFNAGLNGVGIRTPLGSINLKFWLINNMPNLFYVNKT